MVFVVEVAVELDDVGVVEAVQDFYLLGELIDHAVFQHHRLEDLLYGVECACSPMPTLKYVAELPRTDILSQFEILDPECPPLLFNDALILGVLGFSGRDHDPLANILPHRGTMHNLGGRLNLLLRFHDFLRLFARLGILLGSVLPPSLQLRS